MVTLEIVYTDPDLIECVICAQSGSFRAATSIYFTSDSLLELASVIAGFPSLQGDHREFAAETLGDTFRLELDTFEATGRCIATIVITDARHTQQSATIRFAVYAGEVDSFERDIRALSKNEEGIATLGAHAASAV
jgi:hypothetical protein